MKPAQLLLPFHTEIVRMGFLKKGEIIVVAKKKITNKKTAKKKMTKKKAKSSPRKKLKNFVVWFEIPVVNLDRAMKFYGSVFGVKLESMDMGESKGAMFPFEDGIASGALIQSSENKPSKNGTMIYLNGGKDLSVSLSKVVFAGGKILQEKSAIGEMGSIAIFEDTEGNDIALHSMK